MITKLSGARIRTTHITGMVTDVGIELGKLAYINRPVRDQHPVKADRGKILLLSGLILMFFVGGVTGAVGFNQYGYPSAFFLAAVLVAMTVIPITNDVIKSGRK
jgi:magnesium-transporting ATPase (P-type)